MGSPVGPIVGVLVFIGCLLMVILLPLSLKRVASTEVAVKYDKVARKLGDELLTEGLHDIGPSGKLLKFDTTKREANFERFNALTKDGLEVEFQVSFNYRVEPKKDLIFKIIENFGDQAGHDTYIYALCSSTIRDVSVKFTASTYYLQREDFEEDLQATITQRFLDYEVGARLEFVQVVNIELPPKIESAILSTIEAQQDIENARTEKAEAIQQAKIAVQLAEDNADITILNADREAGKIDQETEQSVIVERNRMQLRAYAFGNISQGLGKGGDFFVESYLRTLVLQENKGKTIVGL